MKFFYQIEDYHDSDDWIEIDAWDEEHAAEKATEEHYNNSEPWDANKTDLIVLIKNDKNEIVKFRMSGDYSVNFYANEVD